MPINKTTFYPGEMVKIYGTISPVPENKNIQLARWYYCPASAPEYPWWRFEDLWTTCDNNGYYEFTFPATLYDVTYCRVTTSQNFYALVRYQPVIGEPPTTFESVQWTVLNIQRIPTNLTLSAEKIDTNVYKLSVVLKDINGNPLNRKLIKIYRNGELVFTTFTDSNGYAFVNITLDPGTYEFYAEFEGDETYQGC